VFSQRLSPTRRGARLARLLSVGQLSAWGIAYDSDLSTSAALVVAELATNAITHGRVPGRDFELRLTLEGDVLTVAISDARGERLPRPAETPHDEAITGRGLRLVEALATRWGTTPRAQAGKTVWAELCGPHAMPSQQAEHRGRGRHTSATYKPTGRRTNTVDTQPPLRTESRQWRSTT
jgi:anti-sigma regulatory factor (Ser/Thr protein kinase)